ncbi:hypothetical protein TNCT_699531 [Trichonephila clavata]|uniref:Uncharacterized protein n=1 Tax=Trichonephila clavata TaxID=2740835 RepID=A0A8X6M1F6_TRICU|nr:hypothetical protein TNCT_699531 [Trichonephila clavata]
MKLIATSALDRAQSFVSSISHVTPKIAHFSPPDAIDTKSVFPPSVLSNLHRNEAQLYIESSVYGYIEMVFMAALV